MSIQLEDIYPPETTLTPVFEAEQERHFRVRESYYILMKNYNNFSCNNVH